MGSASPVRGDVLERAVALRTLGKEWAHIAAELGVRVDQVSNAVRRHNLAAGNPLGSECAERPAGPRPPAASTILSRPEPLVKAPAVHTTSKTTGGNWLWISDLQLPFEDPRALAFCQQARRDYNVPMSNIGCVGDEVDFYWASRFPKSPDALYTANQELDAARVRLETWGHAFPDMLVCDSNHRGRAAKAFERGGIPTRLLVDLREALHTPPGWRWAEHWIIDAGRLTYRAEHGHKGPGGHTGLRTRPLWRGLPTLWGHEHKEPATLHVDTDDGRELWGMRVGSLMERKPTDANSYAQDQAGLPSLSVGVVLDGGRTPLIVRM